MREDLVDDNAVLTCAKRLMSDGIYPTGLAVTQAMGWRWVESVVCLSLARLRHSGRLVVAMRKPMPRRKPDPPVDPAEVAELARQVRYEGRVHPASKGPPTTWEWLSERYWAAVPRAWYRRSEPCA